MDKPMTSRTVEQPRFIPGSSKRGNTRRPPSGSRLFPMCRHEVPLLSDSLPLVGDPMHMPALHHPTTADPVVRFAAPGPVSGSPDIAVARWRGVLDSRGWRRHVRIDFGAQAGRHHDLGADQDRESQGIARGLHRSSPIVENERIIRYSYDLSTTSIE